VVFAIGFAVGAVRVLLVEPLTGPILGVAVEIPLMLTVSWVSARAVADYLRVSKQLATRLVMGAIATALLVAAESALGVAFGQSLAQQVAAYGTARGALTLIGQLGFALMPVLTVRK